MPYQGWEAAGVLEEALDRKQPLEAEAGLLLLPFWKAAYRESLRCVRAPEQRPPCRLPINVRRTPVQLTTIGFLRGEGECVGSDVGEKG